MRKRVYIETSVISYLAGRPSRNLLVAGIPLLKLADSAVELSKKLISGNALPTKATDDALHIALSAVHNIDYLLTWNCRHIDNAEIKPLVRSVIIANGYNYPEICTPQELIGGDSDEE